MPTFSDRVIDLALAIEDGADLLLPEGLVHEVAAAAEEHEMSPILIGVLTDPASPEVVRLRAMVILTIRLHVASQLQAA